MWVAGRARVNAMWLEVRPLGARIAVAPGESLLEAAERAGYSWPSVCGREGVCSTCAVDVVSTDEPLPPASSAETETLQILPRWSPDSPLRLACQIRPTADLVVRKIGVREVAS